MSVVSRPPLWPHQERGVNETIALFERDVDRVCVTGPTGSGKTRTAAELMEWACARGYRSIYYTNRRLLLEQLCRTFASLGISYGVRASGFDDLYDPHQPIQLASTQTEHTRAYRSGGPWKPFQAELVCFDELHLQKGKMAREIMQSHLDRHSSRMAHFTATPLGVSDLADELVVAGTVSECRETGSLLYCEVYGGTEIDTRHIQRAGDDGEFALTDVRRCWTQQIFGHVVESWKEHNPDQRPTVLFAPGVAESVWFAQEFERIGVSAAHIDGADVYVDGERRKTSRDERDKLMERVRSGDVKVLSNRYVAREGVDLPELHCCILACPIGSLTSYLQTVGRVLRTHPSMDHVVLIDHGGNWYRHGSPNIDRDWAEVWKLQPRVITDLRIHNMRERVRDETTGEPIEKEPICCSKCGFVRKDGIKCPMCGTVSPMRTRKVLQADGTLVHLNGSIFTPRRTKVKPNTERIWEQCYWRCMKKGKTFRQAYGLFWYENRYFPPLNLPLMPRRSLDWFRKVAAVDKEELL